MQLCDTFHLPLISLVGQPGFLVGIDSEKQGIERAGARLVAMTCMAEMPWISVVPRRVYGVAGQCHHRPTGMFSRVCWPSHAGFDDGRGDRPGHHRPRETRPVLAEFVIEAQRILSSQLGRPSIPYLP